MAKLNNSLCAINNLIFVARICKILNYQYNEHKLNKNSPKINESRDSSIVNELKRDDALLTESTQKFNRYLTYTLLTNIICSATSIAICRFFTNKLIATIVNAGLTVANASGFMITNKIFPKLQNSCGFVEKDVSNIDAKKFHYNLNTQTLVSKRVVENKISADDYGNIVYNHKSGRIPISLRNCQKGTSKFSVLIDNVDYNITIDKLGCIKAKDNYSHVGYPR